MNETARTLFDARKAALERGDDALAREIYHQLVGMGYRAENIDAGHLGTTVADDSYVLAAEREAAATPAPPVEPETTAVEAPERAVKPSGRPRRAK